MRRIGPYHVEPHEVSALLVLARKHRGLSRLAAARLIDTDQSNLRKAELHAERHLVYAVEMLNRYARLEGEPGGDARVKVVMPAALNTLVDDLREPVRAPLRDLTTRVMSDARVKVEELDDRSVLRLQAGSSRVTVYLDRRTVKVEDEAGWGAWLAIAPSATDEEIVAAIVSKITSTNSIDT